MKTYLVGGSVRDEILGLPVTDHDYVVVGSSPDEMIRLGYRPVGKDFPVFLHPESQEQYALARTERKVSRGYKGFEVYASPEVTLQEDLARRDLTINSIAKDQDGNIIDPFDGVADLEAGLLRHISPAFTEDPVRVLRTARFAARFGFRIAPRDPCTDERDGTQRRGGCAGAGADVAGVCPRVDGAQTFTHVLCAPRM